MTKDISLVSSIPIDSLYPRAPRKSIAGVPSPQEAVALPTRAQEELDHGAIAAAYAMTPTLSDTVKSASVQALMSSTV